MPTAFPARATITGTPDNAGAQTWLTAIWDAITGLLGTSGTLADARSQLGVDQPVIAATVASSALTISLKSANGSTPTAAAPLPIDFRSATLSSGVTNVRSVTSGLTLTVSNGSTLGGSNALDQWLYVYVLDNAGTVELAVSGSNFGANFIGSTTAEGGAGAADSVNVLYSATARTNVPMRLLASLRSNQATAGAWTSAPLEITYPDLATSQPYRAAGAGGSADALTASFVPVIPSLSVMNGISVFVRASSANTTATPTIAFDGLAAKTIVKGNNQPLLPGDISGAGHWLDLKYDRTLDVVVLQNPASSVSPTVPRNYIEGLTLSTAGASTTMGIALGVAADDTNSVLMSGGSFSKTTAAWAAGNGGALDTGSIAANTWYYWYLIKNQTTGATDYLCSLSFASPGLPSGFTLKRYIGAGRTNALGQWLKFKQFGDYFTWDVPALDFSSAGSTTAALLTCSVPSGRKVKAYFNFGGTSSGTAGMGTYLSDPDVSDLAPAASAAPLMSAYMSADPGAEALYTQVECWTNASGQIRHREWNTSTVYLATIGWMDLRGKGF